ncbi:MAG TPA: TIGR02678 family protein [Acetobacteraceae bacterium]|jgi:uncharacterized protein (TIGR02678 family)
MATRPDSRSIGEQQQQHRRQEFRTAVRAVLMTPLMSAGHPDFPTVRRQADTLREWFARETGWMLHIEQDCVRLYKRPADLSDATRGLPGYDRRRYVLLCLACAVLERADPQITLRVLGERLLLLAADPALAESGFTFALATVHERRELVSVCRTLLDLGVLLRVAGDEEAFVRIEADSADALYDVHRRTLSGMLAAVRGPSTWPPAEAPVTLEARLHALVDEHLTDSEEGHRSALRHALSRRLLDDPVVYLDGLDEEQRGYFINQRGAMAARLAEATGLSAEQRAEGLALIDAEGELTDIAMPAEGTDAHATLLVAGFLAGARRTADASDVVAFLRDAKAQYGRYWRKSAREPHAEAELAAIALERLEKLRLIRRDGPVVRPRPALARFASRTAEIRPAAGNPASLPQLL